MPYTDCLDIKTPPQKRSRGLSCACAQGTPQAFSGGLFFLWQALPLVLPVSLLRCVPGDRVVLAEKPLAAGGVVGYLCHQLHLLDAAAAVIALLVARPPLGTSPSTLPSLFLVGICDDGELPPVVPLTAIVVDHPDGRLSYHLAITCPRLRPPWR